MTLRVVLQVVPFGDEDRTREIGRLDIFNKGIWDRDDIGRCEYGVIDLFPKHVGLYSKSVLHFRNLGAWELLRGVLEELPIEGP